MFKAFLTLDFRLMHRLTSANLTPNDILRYKAPLVVLIDRVVTPHLVKPRLHTTRLPPKYSYQGTPSITDQGKFDVTFIVLVLIDVGRSSYCFGPLK